MIYWEACRNEKRSGSEKTHEKAGKASTREVFQQVNLVVCAICVWEFSISRKFSFNDTESASIAFTSCYCTFDSAGITECLVFDISGDFWLKFWLKFYEKLKSCKISSQNSNSNFLTVKIHQKLLKRLNLLIAQSNAWSDRHSYNLTASLRPPSVSMSRISWIINEDWFNTHETTRTEDVRTP